jgi:XTP/dITP diphosphohydrolase
MVDKKEDIYFITGNHNKFSEIEKLFQKEKLNYRLKQINLPTIEIQSHKLKEVAKFKLESVKDKLDHSFFIEDAGFFVDIPLKGFPGVWSKYVFNTIGNEGILKLIDDFTLTKAHFKTVIALYHKSSDKIHIFKGIVKGQVSKIIRGENGFGFDPIFIPDEKPNKTFAELSTLEKNAISHRGKAWRNLLNFLKKNPY